MQPGFLGTLGDGSPFYADLNKVIGKHLAVIAATGGGKSYLVGVLCEEFLKMNTPVVIIDPHDEYRTLRFPSPEVEMCNQWGVLPYGFADKIQIYAPLGVGGNIPYCMPTFGLTAKDIQGLVPGKLPGGAIGLLNRACFELRNDKYTITDIYNFLATVETKSDVRFTLLAAIEAIMKTRIFGSPTTPKELVRPGKTSIISLNGVDENLKQTIAKRVITQLWFARKKKTIPPFVMIVEEAHQFIPQGRTLETSAILKTIASEGRKFGLGLCVVTQRPAKISKDVLSQCYCQIYLRLTNPNDIKTVYQSIENVTKDLPHRIKRLAVGECIVSGLSSESVTVKVRARQTRHGGVSELIVRKGGKLQ